MTLLLQHWVKKCNNWSSNFLKENFIVIVYKERRKWYCGSDVKLVADAFYILVITACQYYPKNVLSLVI